MPASQEDLKNPEAIKTSLEPKDMFRWEAGYEPTDQPCSLAQTPFPYLITVADVEQLPNSAKPSAAHFPHAQASFLPVTLSP